ncbi:U5 small nuclear ribonucleoprotein helicase [Perilla frutescens var. hirtella]|nr:U5 small nuclear ribonucleoprotein helicase [Perilla frutescens var. hirtella]
MLVELPRLTNSLRSPFDADQAYLNRKSFLQNLNRRSSAASVGESELAHKIIYRWDEASFEVRQLYKQFVAAVVELMGGEVVSEEFQEVAIKVYRLFSGTSESEHDERDKRIMSKKFELQKLVGHSVPDANILKVASLVEKLSSLQNNEHGPGYLTELMSEGSEDVEFGVDLAFRSPARFLVDMPLENGDVFLEETGTSSCNHERWSDFGGSAKFQPSVGAGNYDLDWLRDACDRIVRASTSQLPRDELAMTICRILDSEKPGDEIAGDLLDLVGDSSFEIVQDLIMHRKDLVESIHHGLLVLKSDRSSSNTQIKYPSYATQVTVQTESERQIDKLRRKEEKKNRRGTDHGAENDLSSFSFSSLLQASEKKTILDDLVGQGDGAQFAATALPHGTVRKHYKGYEEVIIPPTPTAPMKPGEKLVEIKELDDIAQAAFHGYKSLNRIQSRIYQTTYYSNTNILVCAPTGAGKTNIAMISILHEIGQHLKDGYLHKDEFKIVYVAPMKALAAEVTSTFSHRLAPLNITVRELTGDMQLSKNELEETQMIVTTPEKWDVITRKSSDMSLSMLVKLLIIDEVHLLNDDRGPVIEALVARTLRQVESTQSMIRIVGLSATLPNYLEVAQFLRVNPETGLFFFDSSYRPVPLQQHYIGISERNFAARNELMNEICFNKKEVLKSRNRQLVQFFESAVGIHHAGMLRADRGLTERLFSEGLLKVLVCTATLAWGVNLPAHTVVIKFINSLKDNLNAEVALGTVTNVKEACAWLGYTYLFIRMKMNPLAYGIGWDEVIADPSLSLKQRALVSDAARALDKAKMMRFDEKSGNFYCTELGRIASHFYIHYSSVETYNEMLRRHMNDSEVIDMVAHSSEFENIVVREEEQDELEKLARTCPLEIKGGPSNKHGKVSILIQILRKLEEREVDLDRLYEMQEKDIGALIRYAPGGKLVKQYLGYFPMVQLFATVSPITRTVLKVDLTITPEFIWKDRFHGTAQRWWILVEDSENDHIYHSELFTLTKKMAKGEAQKLSFTVPIFEPHPPQYFIRAISDSWLHSESFYTISFQNLTLPEAHTTHTELLDLKPLPVTALGNGTYEALYRFTHFNPIQTQAFHVLYHTDQNVLLGAPTGSGKTISAELAMLHLFNTEPDMKVIYIAPLKALVRERMNDWRKRLVSQLGKHMVLGFLSLVELTGEYTPNLTALLSADIIISTPEKWDGISRNWHTRSYVKKVGLMILDEIHLLGADRGPILEGYPGKFYCPRMNSMNKPAYAAICTHSPRKPVLIFVSSRRQTRLTALDLIQYAASDEHPRQFLEIPEESLQMIVSQVTDQNLRHTLQFGIGLHHAGLNDKDRSLVEELFANNKIQVLVCTSTLAWGVNLPAHLVIIKGTEYFDAKSKRYVDFPITDILQMMGRAGRPQFDQHGKAIILVHEPKKSFYKKFLYEPFPVESSLREQLHDHINAEIVSGTIRHKEDAIHYLTWTYLFRRLGVNPAYYGLEHTDPGTLSSYLSSLVLNTFEDLEDGGCIKIEEDRVEPMMLGSIASQYYLKYTTVSMFASNIEADTSLEVFLHVLSGASEYDELPVRHNEENHNAELSSKVRYMVDKNLLDDPHVKTNLLFQAHFSRVELPVTDYVTDLKSVLDQSIRIIQAMIDLCANSGWLSSTITCMHLLQMVMQGLWCDKDSSLWMLPCMTDDLVSALSQRGILNVLQLLDVPQESLQFLSKSSTASRLHEELQHFPHIQARLRVQQRSTADNPCVNLNVRLEKTNRHKKTARAFTPRFPKVKDEAWWLVLANTSSSQLYALKRVSFTDVLVTNMALPSNVNDFQGMKLIMVSDCYVGFDQEFSIEQLV